MADKFCCNCKKECHCNDSSPFGRTFDPHQRHWSYTISMWQQCCKVMLRVDSSHWMWSYWGPWAYNTQKIQKRFYKWAGRGGNASELRIQKMYCSDSNRCIMDYKQMASKLRSISRLQFRSCSGQLCSRHPVQAGTSCRNKSSVFYEIYTVKFIPLLGSLCMFRVFYTPIIRSTIFNCIYSHWYKQ